MIACARLVLKKLSCSVSSEEEEPSEEEEKGQGGRRGVGLASAADEGAFVFCAKGQGIGCGGSAAGIGDLELKGVGAFCFDEEGEGGSVPVFCGDGFSFDLLPTVCERFVVGVGTTGAIERDLLTDEDFADAFDLCDGGLVGPFDGDDDAGLDGADFSVIDTQAKKVAWDLGILGCEKGGHGFGSIEQNSGPLGSIKRQW